MTTEIEKITITMSEQRPLKIDPNAWPVIARVTWHDGQVECQANHVRSITVREHADGRRIVYGIYDSGPGGCYQGFRGARGGFFVGSMNELETIRAIRRVAGIIGDDALGDECISDLPAEELQ